MSQIERRNNNFTNAFKQYATKKEAKNNWKSNFYLIPFSSSLQGKNDNLH